jgi:hypothetical protein
MTSNLSTIPPELQVQILCNLDAGSLVRCAMVSQFLIIINLAEELNARGYRRADA